MNRSNVIGARARAPCSIAPPAFFKQLTLGSFESLRIDYDDDDQAVLLAVRPGGTEAVGIAGLSLGTADQLYLALRLASLETYLEKNEPVPLIVDDVLIQFDDDRAAAAFGALADLSLRTQIIMFTHHEHVRQLAKECVEPDRLILHDLYRAEDRGNRHGAGERKIEMIASRRLTCSRTPSIVNRPSGAMGTMVKPGRVREARWKCHGDPRGNGRFSEGAV